MLRTTHDCKCDFINVFTNVLYTTDIENTIMTSGRSLRDYSQYLPRGHPVKHRKKVPFKPEAEVSPESEDMVSEIRSMDEEMEFMLLSEMDYRDLVVGAYARNIHWSTKIEGNTLPYEGVHRIISRFVDGRKEDLHDKQVREIINQATLSFNRGPFGMEHPVTGTHRVLMEGLDQAVPGAFRTSDVVVMSDSGWVKFIACPKDHVVEEIRSLDRWDYGGYNEVVGPALKYHEFESIHPFADGNGRTGRALFEQWMEENELLRCRNSGWAEALLSDTGTYYDLLAYTDSVGDYGPFVDYVVESVHRAYTDLYDAVSSKDLAKGMGRPLWSVAFAARGLGYFTVPYMAKETFLTEGQAAECLRDLQAMGLVEESDTRYGEGYRFLDPFEDVRDRIRVEWCRSQRR